ncbi:hypothetical protein MG3_01682 [Candida albicans P78048]|uniref:Uncharacterized protein n=1 Tax=Candida albicans P78048 TaxID=1094989 RepID=A0AB34PW85_CANAX|nr:hypothetical protein MG3_01682 [Candida albicans P78048]
MPTSYKGDPTFHISQLRLKKTVPANYLVAPSEPVAWKRYKDGSILVDVVAIVGHRKVGRGFRFAARHAPTTTHPDGEIVEYIASALSRTAPDLVKEYVSAHGLPVTLK